MARGPRLLGLIQALRRHRRPVTAQALAAELGVSLRTIYRDIATLQGQGAAIQGEAGLGYVLRAGYLLPPLMFAIDEVEALALGSRWVREHGDPGLARAAEDAMARIAAVLPPVLRDMLDETTLLIGPDAGIAGEPIDIAAVRTAIREGRKLSIRYQDAQAQPSHRVIWPFALGFFSRVRVIVAWCELRQAFRHFRTDRVVSLTALPERAPRRRQALLKAWKAEQAIAADRN